MEVVLEVETGTYAGKENLIRPGDTLPVGRTVGAGVMVSDDPTMSRQHFAIECLHGECRIRDMGSSYGTFVNDQKISTDVLKDGDRILAGSTRFKIRIVQTTPSTNSKSASGPDPIFEKTLADEDPTVARQALITAAWTRQSWLLGYLREAAKQPTAENWDLVKFLAILGKPADCSLFLKIAENTELGAPRFEALGTFGHPATVPFLLDALSAEDPAVAVPAGLAFVRMVGTDIDSNERVVVPPEDGSTPGEFEAEFLEDAVLPDPQLAADFWKTHQERLNAASRLCRGADISQGVPPDLLQTLDLQTRWEVCLRGRFEGTWNGRYWDWLRVRSLSETEDGQS